MENFHTIDSYEFCVQLRKKCPFDDSVEWIFYIDGEVENQDNDRGSLLQVGLDEDKDHLIISVKWDEIETYDTSEFCDAFSSVDIRSFSYPQLFSEELQSRDEFQQEQDSYNEKREAERLRNEWIGVISEKMIPIIEGSEWEKIEGVRDKIPDVPVELFNEVKAKCIQEFLGTRFNKHFLSDYEKAAAVAINDQHFLLKARAGSGKTTVLAMRAVLLAEKFDVFQDHMMILAFNRGAASEIRFRIQETYGLPTFGNARTFHSLAMAIVQPDEGLLFDEGSHAVSQKLSNFVQSIIRDIWNPIFQAEMHLYFRKEMKELEDHGQTLSPEKLPHLP